MNFTFKDVTKTVALSLGVLALSCVAYTKVDAAEWKAVPPKTSSEPFDDLAETDTVLVLENGSVVHGMITVYKNGENDEGTVFNSDTDPKAITVKQFRKLREQIQREEAVQLPLLSATPTLRSSIIPPSNTIKMALGVAILSHYLTGGQPGYEWVFGDDNYYPAAGTGDYLYWETHKDSALVGSPSAAQAAYHTGVGHGTAIYPGSPVYVKPSSGNTAVYFSHYPLAGSFYEVKNI